MAVNEHDMTKSQKTKVQNYDRLIGQKLRAARKASGLSQSALGERVGLTFQQIQKHENGLVRISAGRLAHIAAALNIPIQFFYDDLGGLKNGETVSEFSLLNLAKYSDIKSSCIQIIADADEDDVAPLFQLLAHFMSQNAARS